MTRRLSPEKQLELERLSRLLGIMAGWADTLSGLPPEGDTFTKAVTRASEAKNLPGLQMILNDLVAMTQAASLDQRQLLDRQLKERAGVSLGSLMQRQFATVERILKRGKLTSDQQYYLIREHIEVIADDQTYAADLPALYAMIEAYETLVAKRAGR
ncbi:MAG: hypothetical protein JWO05_2862 [Gemmatimonadetes bacterium]|nr:hypothetical protein [Gemmatimonadota bacterium]